MKNERGTRLASATWPSSAPALITPPLAHVGHWYHSLLYLAPVLIVVVVLWVQERRERGREADEDESAP